MAEDLEEDFDEGESSDDLDHPPPRRGGGGGVNRRMILFVLLPLLLVVGAAVGLYFSGVADPLLKVFQGAEKPKEETLQPAVFRDLPEMLVNLNTTGRKQSFLKIKVALELESALDESRIDSVLPRIIDSFQVYLRELRLEDLQGAAGLYRLREELLIRVNAAAKPAKVNDVLFKEMLVQ